MGGAFFIRDGPPESLCSNQTKPNSNNSRRIPQRVAARPKARLLSLKGTVRLKLSAYPQVFGGFGRRRSRSRSRMKCPLRSGICLRFLPVQRAFACRRGLGVCSRGFPVLCSMEDPGRPPSAAAAKRSVTPIGMIRLQTSGTLQVFE